MKSRVAPECGLEFSDRLGEPGGGAALLPSGIICYSE